MLPQGLLRMQVGVVVSARLCEEGNDLLGAMGGVLWSQSTKHALARRVHPETECQSEALNRIYLGRSEGQASRSAEALLRRAQHCHELCLERHVQQGAVGGARGTDDAGPRRP